jgi:hypothetical protein
MSPYEKSVPTKLSFLLLATRRRTFRSAGQIDPDVVVAVRVLDHERRGALHVGGLEEADHALLVDAVRQALRDAAVDRTRFAPSSLTGSW